jgi:capsular polysaccharide transport system permease protein
MTNTAERVGEAINGNRALLYYPQVHRLDLVFARALLESATVITVFVVIMGAHAVYVGRLEIDDPLRVMATLLLGSLFGTALGLNFCMLGVVTQTIDRLRGPIMRPLFWISGIFFTIQAVPHELRRYVLVNPLFHVTELVRSAWFRTYEAPHASSWYVIWWILAMMVAGLLLERAVRRKIEVG